MNLHPELTDAADAGARVVAGVRPGQFGDSTPDTEWDVRTLLNHLLLWTAYNFERRAHGEMVPEEMMTRDFAAEPDFAAAYRAQLDRALDAWADPAVWEKDLNVMGSATPAADVGAMMLAELVLHGWDLAAATGQSYTVSDRAAAAALAAVRGERGDVPAVQGVRRAGFPAGRRGGARPRARAVRARPGLDAVPVACRG